jgi:hypothetical protein
LEQKATYSFHTSLIAFVESCWLSIDRVISY